MINKKQRATAVRPKSRDNNGIIAPIDGDVGDSEAADCEKEVEAEDEWGTLADKYEELERKVHDYFDEQQNLERREPPIVRAPQPMTREEWNKHQVTHTPYMASCKHCVAARAVRQKHPRKRKHMHLVKDVDGSQGGPVKISMDYMYLDEKGQRRSRYADQHAQPCGNRTSTRKSVGLQGTEQGRHRQSRMDPE